MLAAKRVISLRLIFAAVAVLFTDCKNGGQEETTLKEIQTETIRKLFEKGVSYEVVKASVDLFTDEELNEIYEQVRLAS